MFTMIIMTAFSWQARFLLPNSVLRRSGEWLSIILSATTTETVGAQWKISIEIEWNIDFDQKAFSARMYGDPEGIRAVLKGRCRSC